MTSSDPAILAGIRGTRAVFRKLRPEQVDTIRWLIAAGVPRVEIARQYGVDRQTIYRALKRSGEHHEVAVVGAWEAEFVVTDAGPLQVGPWYARTDE